MSTAKPNTSSNEPSTITPTAKTGAPIDAQIMPPTRPDAIWAKPIMAAAEPAICGKGATAAVII